MAMPTAQRRGDKRRFSGVESPRDSFRAGSGRHLSRGRRPRRATLPEAMSREPKRHVCRVSVASQDQSVVETVEKRLLIGGEWRDACGGETFAVENPSTGETLCEIADGTPDDAMAALDAAVAAQAEWAATTPNERTEILHKAFEALGERADELALLMTLEMGKAVAESKAEITYAAEFFRWFSGEALRVDGYYKNAGNGASRVLVMRQPVGPCLLHHPLELPDGDGHPQDRPGDRRRMHDGRQAGPAHAALDDRPGRSSSRSAACRRASSTSSPARPRATSPVRSSPTRGCASSRSPAQPRSAASSSRRRPTACSRSPWSSAATRRSWSSRTPTSTPPSRGR